MMFHNDEYVFAMITLNCLSDKGWGEIVTMLNGDIRYFIGLEPVIVLGRVPDDNPPELIFLSNLKIE